MKFRTLMLLIAGMFGAPTPQAALAQAPPCPPELELGGESSASIPCSLVSSEADWVERSTGPGVIWAHDFRHESELWNFIRYEGVTNPDPASLPNGLHLTDTRLGNSRAIVSRAIGAVITQATPEGAPYDVQVWHVSDASVFPDPTRAPYEILVGKPNARAETSSGGLEWVELQARDTDRNTITVKRQMNNNTVKVEGVNYSRAMGVAPSFPAGYTVGRGPQGSWNRPFAAFPEEQNGLPTPDIGIANGTVTRTRTWDPTRGGRGHLNFREGYFGHRSYWDPAAGSAIYRDWQPHDPGNEFPRQDAWDGDEFYIQFRAKISTSRFDAAGGKMLFIQNASTSGTGQFFWTVGGNRYGELRPEAERRPGVQYGGLLLPVTAYADSAAPAGGVLSVPQGDSADTNDSLQKPSYPECIWDNRPGGQVGTGMYCWTFPADQWVTYLLHFKFGRDNAPINPVEPAVGGSNGAASTVNLTGPWPAETDSSYRTTFELMVADEGDGTYRTITSSDEFVWFFGDGKYQAGYYYYNPPGLNAFWMSQNLNDYVGGGSVAPPGAPYEIQYTQAILSTSFIPAPQDLTNK